MTEEIENLADVVKKLQEAMQKNQGGSVQVPETERVAWSSDDSSDGKQVTSN